MKIVHIFIAGNEKHLNICLTIQSQVLIHINLSPTINRDSLRILETEIFEFRSNWKSHLIEIEIENTKIYFVFSTFVIEDWISCFGSRM